MWNEPTKEELQKIPEFHATADIPFKDKLIYMHFFLRNFDWFICEYDGQDLMFGYAILNGDTENAEWGYVSFNELCEVRINLMEVEYDLYWRVVPAREVPLIRC